MSKNKYQVWEGEMEVQHLDTCDATLATVIVSAMLGILLFVILLCKTALEGLLKQGEEKKRLNRSFRSTVSHSRST